MIYKEKGYAEIFNKMLQDAFQEQLISHDGEFDNYIANRKDISNFYVMLLSIHSEALKDVYREITKVYNSNKVELAEGIDLDDLGKIVNCSRPLATKSKVELVFSTTQEIEEPITIPTGVLVSNNEGILYETEDSFEFSSGITDVPVSATALKAGVGNYVAENTLTRIESNIPISRVSVTNPKASTGGAEAYTDEQYRELLSNWVKITQRGNEWAYKNYFSRCDGIDDYKIIPNWDGSGTVKVIVSTNDVDTLNKVYNDLQKTVTQATEDIVVLAPSDKEIDIHIKCNVDIDRLNPFNDYEKDAIKSKIENEIRNYILSLKIGEDFIPHKLAVAVDKNVSELKNIEFNNPSEPIVVSDEEKCIIGEVTVIME